MWHEHDSSFVCKACHCVNQHWKGVVFPFHAIACAATVCTTCVGFGAGSLESCKNVPKQKACVQVLERQKQWQQRWREQHEREGTLYGAVAVVEDVIIGR